MKTYKRDRVENVMRKYLSEIICYELKEPICMLASINEIRYNDDMSIAKVYVTHLEKEKASNLVNFLNKRAKLIRSLMSKKMSIYKVPTFVFIEDTLYDKAKKIDDLIEKVMNTEIKTLDDISKNKE